jgi:hypothetical protein
MCALWELQKTTKKLLCSLCNRDDAVFMQESFDIFMES